MKSIVYYQDTIGTFSLASLLRLLCVWWGCDLTHNYAAGQRFASVKGDGKRVYRANIEYPIVDVYTAGEGRVIWHNDGTSVCTLADSCEVIEEEKPASGWPSIPVHTRLNVLNRKSYLEAVFAGKSEYDFFTSLPLYLDGEKICKPWMQVPTKLDHRSHDDEDKLQSMRAWQGDRHNASRNSLIYSDVRVLPQVREQAAKLLAMRQASKLSGEWAAWIEKAAG